MFRIKICGVKQVEDAIAIAEAGADALGINFYAGSPRCATEEEATAIAGASKDRLLLVGVFVNELPARIVQLAEIASLDIVQLHGDEPPEFLGDLPEDLLVIRAVRMGESGLIETQRYLGRCNTLGRLPDAVLVDAAAGSAYGGTGQKVDWVRLAEERPRLGGLPLILAGGLGPKNVAEAIEVVRPEGVDTASGVERAPGEKDSRLVARFAAAAGEALRTHGTGSS